MGAVARLERAGFVRAIRRRRNPRFSEVNIYILEHPEAARAAAREAWREEEAVQVGSGAAEGLGASPGSSPASNSSPKGTHKNLIEDSTTKLQVKEVSPDQPSNPTLPVRAQNTETPLPVAVCKIEKAEPMPLQDQQGRQNSEWNPCRRQRHRPLHRPQRQNSGNVGTKTTGRWRKPCSRAR